MKNLDEITLNAMQKAINWLSRNGVDTAFMGQQSSIFIFVDALIFTILSNIRSFNEMPFNKWSDVLFDTLTLLFLFSLGVITTAFLTYTLYVAYSKAYTRPTRPFSPSLRPIFLFLTPTMMVAVIYHMATHPISGMDILEVLKLLVIIPTVYGAFCVHRPPSKRQDVRDFKVA